MSNLASAPVVALKLLKATYDLLIADYLNTFILIIIVLDLTI